MAGAEGRKETIPERAPATDGRGNLPAYLPKQKITIPADRYISRETGTVHDAFRGLPVTVVISGVIGLIQLVISLILAVVALYTGSFALNRIAKGIDVQAELKRGNIAMGIFIASVYIAISVIVISCIQGILVGLNKIFADGILNVNDSPGIASSILELFLGVLLAIASIYLAILVFAHLYRRTDMITAIEHGNVTIAFIVAGMILAVSVIFRIGVLGIITALF
jgi:uncharacterized membrane protein YjfL (UPF0719 family)